MSQVIEMDDTLGFVETKSMAIENLLTPLELFFQWRYHILSAILLINSWSICPLSSDNALKVSLFHSPCIMHGVLFSQILHALVVWLIFRTHWYAPWKVLVTSIRGWQKNHSLIHLLLMENVLLNLVMPWIIFFLFYFCRKKAVFNFKKLIAFRVEYTC